MTHHEIALRTVILATLLDAACGVAYAIDEQIPLWHGLYCALANAVTVGGDVSPTNGLGYGITAVECLLVVPLFAATFSLFTSGLTAIHVKRSEVAIKQHVTEAHRDSHT